MALSWNFKIRPSQTWLIRQSRFGARTPTQIFLDAKKYLISTPTLNSVLVVFNVGEETFPRTIVLKIGSTLLHLY